MNPLRIFGRPPARAARFPEGRVGYAVGDVHGRVDLLGLLVDELEDCASADERENGLPIVIFLGDYVDRGPDSNKVIELLLAGRPAGFERRFLRGNHEQVMQAFMDDPLSNRSWMLQGGAETLEAYGVRPPAPMTSSNEEWRAAAEALREAVPAAHIEFLSGLERYVALGDYAFVHAGVNPARALEQQTDKDLYWARERFTNSRRPFSHRIVHGHTPVDRPYIDQRRIAVDTGAYVSGELTAARFEGEKVSFISVNRRADSGNSPRPASL